METTMSGFAAWTWISASALSDTDVRSHLTDNAVKRLASRIKQDAGYEASENFDLVLVAVPKDHARNWVDSVLTHVGPEAKEPR
jgi:N-acetyl-gamma-glutamylphosphate reductase